MKRKSSFFTRLPALWAASALLAADAAVFRALRMVWVFYDPALRFLGGALGLFVFMLCLCAVSFALLLLRLSGRERGGKPLWQSKRCTVASGVCFVFSVLFAAAIAAILSFSGGETSKTMLFYLQNDLPVLLGFAAAAGTVLVLPRLGARGRTVCAVCFFVCAAAAVLWLFGVRLPYRLVSAPVVMDTGKDYAVLFATSEPGTGYVTCSVDGTAQTIFDRKNGRRVGDRRLHTVHVPYDALKNSSYTVGSTRVIEEFSYGSRLGATVTGGPYTLHVNEGETQTYLLISDWHTYLKDAKAAISHLGDYDAVLMLGDPAPGMDFEAQAVRYLVQFGGELTGGEKPVLYVRGNHETRGPFAAAFPERIGYAQLYYTADRGPYSFLVLDSGEDKPDSHIEYGGMDDYARNRREELQWLQSVEPKNEKLIVLTHAWQFDETDETTSRAAWDAFSALGARFVLSGHKHTCEFLSAKDEDYRPYAEAYPNITAYIDGGHSGKTYIASKLTLTPKEVQIEAVNNRGAEVENRVLPW